MQFIKCVQNFSFQNTLWQKGSKIVVGVSGGSDSMCLLHVLNKLSSKYDLSIHVAHINYGLRGDDSKKDELLIRNFCKKNELQVSVYMAKKSHYKGNLESCLRSIRYDFFEKLRKDLLFDYIAVAHNQNDQAETVLMRIIRGSGLNGLSSMKAKSGRIVRPLLNTSKNEILAYLKENKVKFRTDKTNKDTKFLRNKIRHKLLPHLASNFNPSIVKTLSEWSISVADDYDFINNESERFIQGICKNKCAEFNVGKFLNLHPAIQRQSLRNIFEELQKSIVDIESRQIEEIIKLAKSTKKKSPKALIGGLNILKKGDIIKIFC